MLVIFLDFLKIGDDKYPESEKKITLLSGLGTGVSTL